MGLKFPDTPVYQGFHHPCRFEGNIFDLEVDGEIPDAIKGTFYRAGRTRSFRRCWEPMCASTATGL
jgi:carotenoid cleavage dioxygenase-like enzyme